MTILGVAALPPVSRKLAFTLRGVFWYAVDMAVFLPLIYLYFLGRGLPRDRVELSTENAFHIIELERSLGVVWEPA